MVHELGDPGMDEIELDDVFDLHPSGTTPVEKGVILSIQATLLHDFNDGRGRVPACRLFCSGPPPNRTDWLEVGGVFQAGSREYKVVEFGLKASDTVTLKRIR